MSESIPPLDPDVLESLRGESPAPPGVRARARDRLLAAVSAGAMPTRTGAVVKGGALVLAFLAGAAAGALTYARWRAPTVQVVYVDRVAPRDPVAPANPAIAPVALAAPAAPAAPALPPIAAAPLTMAPASPPSGAQTPSQMSAERKLLDEARAALTQGDPARALERLQRHRRNFPDALLGEERDAMWVQALVKAGRYDEARARADAFHRRTPNSLFGSVVDSALGAIP